MNRNFSQAAVDAVCNIIERHADRGGMVDAPKAWRDLLNLPLDPIVVQDIVRCLERSGYLWFWGEQMFVVRPVRCPKCNRVVEQRLSVHMHEDHPRPVRVEWV